MFHVKCITCKNFDKSDGCKLNLDDETCSSFTSDEQSEDLTLANCSNCVWFSNGFCDFDLTNPKTCRRFKSLKEDC